MAGKMNHRKRILGWVRYIMILAVIGCALAVVPNVQAAVTLNVRGIDNSTSPPTETAVTSYRWLIEEDATYHVPFVGNVPQSDAETRAVNFHQSYMPVVAQGNSAAQLDAVVLDPTKHYHLSVMPTAPGAYSIGGASLAPGQTSATVHLNKLPLPTAKITIFVFEDIAPINNAPDLPNETGLAGVQILLEDAGGRYGMSAGAQMADAFGNMLGTVYLQTCNASGQSPGSGNYGCLDADGVPIPVLDADGDPLVEPLLSGPDGYVTIKNLAPGKYGIQAVPPAGSSYQQTSTIEGTKVIDAWVKANEPPYFAEFGPAGVHVFIGFVKPFINSTVLSSGQTISGQVVNLHLSRPPESAFYNGAPFEHTTPWVGLNSNAGLAGSSVGLYAGRANADGTFTIHNVPPGAYQLVVWDDALDVVFAFHGITVTSTGCITPNNLCNLGEVPVFQWFTRLENWVFNDMNGNGLRDPGEMGIGEQAVNLRWRDGTMYQSAPTDMEGFVPFDQVFPFFAWQVAEVDFARFKATGVTVTVDDGGPIPFGTGGELLRDQLKPQPQMMPPDDGQTNAYSSTVNRTEVGPVLSQAFQGFLGQTSVLEWGKKTYEPGENGGISGIVFYSTTRAEDDPKYGFGEPWEPGIPRVTVNLYDSTGTTLLNTTTTDSWDDNVPSNCQYGSSDSEPFIFLGVQRDCYDGMRLWNQVRPGVFDGGYAFSSIFVDSTTGAPVPYGTADALETAVIPPGEYIVEVIPPSGYEIVKSQDRNVDFGDNYVPAPHLLPPECVGTPYTVPAELSLFPGTPAAMAGQPLPLCDRKQVFLSDKANAAADFFLFTQVPIAGHIFGIILDDTANEFDPNSPQFGEKYAPPFMPIGIYDWTGRLIGQTYSDQFGRFDALVPSTYTANLPQPSGMSPNMLTTCMNDSNPAADPKGLHNQQYSSFCYNFNYMPGATTYLDTPVVPVAAFAGPDQAPLDCEYPAGTPRIYSVSADNSGGGPYVPATGADRVLTISSMGPTSVLNPEYDGTNAKTISRDYGFGTTPGTVRIGTTALTNVTWGAEVITATVPAGTVTGQLTVTRGDNQLSTIVGVTVHVGLTVNGNNPQTLRRVSPGTPGAIQAAVDAAGPRDLILVSPGTYDEMVIMYKPVRLQGWGEGSTRINAIKVPTNKLQDWRNKVEGLVTSGAVNLLPGQEVAFGGIEPGTLFTEEGAGIIVLASSSTANSPTSTGFGNNRNRGARIDGFTIASADTGGGIMVNGYAPYLEITNNRIVNNSGFYGGGIRVGHPTLTDDANNDYIRISNNHVAQNGGLNGAGGGVSICTGADSYQLSNNYICGNSTLGNGGGIGHLGLSTMASTSAASPLIKGNKILFNQSFNQGLAVSGGGIFIGGQPVLTGLTLGAGTVTIDGNLIQGNQAGAGDGGGIQLMQVNGQDVESNRNQANNWHRVNILNNMIVNNLSGLAGAGIALQDAARTFINHNTVANNDSTATAAAAFSPGTPSASNPQPAGIVSRAHSGGLNSAIGNPEVQYRSPFSNPTLVDNIVWHNRSFYFFGDPGATPPVYELRPAVTAPVFDDLAVLGTATPACLSPRYSLLTSLTEDPACTYGAGANGNLAADPAFVLGYFNGGRGTTVTPGQETTALAAPAAFDEGGNFIQVRFGPLTTVTTTGAISNYHLSTTSPAINSGTAVTGFVPGETLDYDGQSRPLGGLVDIGADEVQ